MTTFNDNINILGGFIQAYYSLEPTEELKNINDILKYCGLECEENKLDSTFELSEPSNFQLSEESTAFDLTEQKAHYYSDYVLMHYYVKKNQSSFVGWWNYIPLITPYFECDNKVFCDKMLELYFDDFVRINKYDYTKLLEFFSRYTSSDLYKRFGSKYNFSINFKQYYKPEFFDNDKVLKIYDDDKKIDDYSDYKNAVCITAITFNDTIYNCEKLVSLTILWNNNKIDLSLLKNLTYLEIKNNRHILDFNHLHNLETLRVNILSLNYSASFLPNLTTLEITDENVYTYVDISYISLIPKLVNLNIDIKTVLLYDANYNETISEMINLKSLKINYGRQIDYTKLTNLECLHTQCNYNYYSKTMKFLTNLKELKIGFSSTFQSHFPNYLKNLSSLERLECSGLISFDFQNDLQQLKSLKTLTFKPEFKL